MDIGSDLLTLPAALPAPRSVLTLLPVRVAWDNFAGAFVWRDAEDGQSLRVSLPFGTGKMTIVPDDAAGDVLAVDVHIEVDRRTHLHELELRYKTNFAPPAAAWVPHLRPGQRLVIADQIFRSPAIVAAADRVVALVPDVTVWPEGIKTYLDFRHTDKYGHCRLTHAVGNWRPSGHILFRKVRGRRTLREGTIIHLRHFLLRLDPDEDLALARIASFIWERFARRGDVAPQVLPFARYEQQAADRIFAPDLFREFACDGRPVAGMITQTLTAARRPGVMDAGAVRSYLRRQKIALGAMRLVQQSLFLNPVGYRVLTRALHTGRVNLLPMASFGTWFNQARTALGAACHARRVGDDARDADAWRIVELALAAPTEGGCPPSVCLFPDGRVSWKRGTRAFEMIDWYHLPDAAVTAFHLLEIHRHWRPDARILERCRALADRFLELQDTGGAIPAWARPGRDDWETETDLIRGASTAGPAMLLAALAREVGVPAYLDAARAALDFIAREVLPGDRWFDFELLYSCAGRFTGRDGPDRFTGVFPANTLSAYWAASAALDVYQLTGETTYLDLGRACLARLSMQQQVFDHPRLAMDTFGGFGVMNVDAEFNDARQGLFAPLYFRYYDVTGAPEMFERGLAALRASFTTMLTPEHGDLAPGNLINYRESDRGAILENYGHTGRDEMTAGYLSPDWGCGTALYASGLAFAQYGQVFVDVPRRLAFGLDRCFVESADFTPGRADLVLGGEPPFPLEIVVRDPDRLAAEIIVNGRAAEPLTARPGRFRVG